MELKDKTDEELVSIIQNSNNGLKEAAFTEMYTRYWSFLYNFIYKFFDNEEETKDAVQEVFLRFFKNTNRYKDIGKFKPWIFTIARNTSLTCLSQKNKKNKIITNDYDSEYNEENDMFYMKKKQINNQKQTLFIQPDELAEKNDICSIVNKELDELTDVSKKVLKLYGIPYKKIAETLNIPEGTVKSRISRGKKYLKKRIEENYSEELADFIG